MRVTYDPQVDAAYIYLVDEILIGGVHDTYPCDPRPAPDGVDGMINLDFDYDDRLIGIEVIDASKRLPKALLDTAEEL